MQLLNHDYEGRSCSYERDRKLSKVYPWSEKVVHSGDLLNKDADSLNLNLVLKNTGKVKFKVP